MKMRAIRPLDTSAIRSRLISSIAAISLLAPSAALAAKCSLKTGSTLEQSRAGSCGFDPVARAFKGSPAEQAACLTRAVKRGAEIGEPTLPETLRRIVGTPTNITISVLATYTAKLGVADSVLGGEFAQIVPANYFIIHDTSTPNCSDRDAGTAACPVLGEFPAQRDTAAWSENTRFHGHPKKAPNRIANVFISRIGTSITEVDFADTFYTTRFETCVDAPAKVGLFVGVENIQPRIGSPAKPALGVKPNDVIAPVPGFTPAQYERLALVYVVASVRHGSWMIPAFHAVIDQVYAGGHDDPQNFDIAAFASAVQVHVAASTK
jgi:hypothetical protein